MKPRDASARPASRLLTGIVFAAAAAALLVATPAAARAQATAQTRPAGAATINCPPPNPKVMTADPSDC
jgi:hypothetical protein